MINNRIILIGHIGNAPEVKVTQCKNKFFSRFTIGTTEKYKQGRKNVTETFYHNITAWGKLAKQTEGLQVNQKVALEGKLIYRNYTDKNGNKNTHAEVQLINIIADYDGAVTAQR